MAKTANAAIAENASPRGSLLSDTMADSLSKISRKSILNGIVLLDAIILALIFIKIFSPLVAYIGGLFMIGYLTYLAISRPVVCFFTIIGIKLTFDALWDVQLDSTLLQFSLLELFIVPVLVLLVTSVTAKYRRGKWEIGYLLFYLALRAFATLMNNVPTDYTILVRQSGILIGFVLGLRFVTNEDDFGTIIRALFISSIVPVAATAFQFFFGDADIPIFHYTIESVRGARQAGLYFDAATNGMTSIIALVSCLYVLQSTEPNNRSRIMLIIFAGLALLAIISGATRSIMIIGAVIIVLFVMKNIRRLTLAIPVLAGLIYIIQPYLESVLLKSTQEIRSEIFLSDLLTSPQYRSLFTGRMSIWQTIWSDFNAGSMWQQFFGSGLISDAHSSYFFLLLQIGWFGLAVYILFHILLLRSVYRASLSLQYKLFGLAILSAVLLMGASASVVNYTSFQWIIYFMIGSLLNIGLASSSSVPAADVRY
ncbi:MAG: hypothetical protein PHY31_01980 [Smithellaceae bacterium]|nr:hypothetical protein [Smithellaceae bacterium]